VRGHDGDLAQPETASSRMSSLFALSHDAEVARSQPAALMLLRSVVGTRGGRAGALLVGAVLALAFLGPFLAPFSPTAIVDTPFAQPSKAHALGTDALGRDGLSRFLCGGRTLALTSFAATLMAYLAGIPLGAFAGVRGGVVDIGAVAVSDLMLAIPPLVFVLVLLAAVGPSLSMVAIGIAAVHRKRNLVDDLDAAYRFDAQPTDVERRPAHGTPPLTMERPRRRANASVSRLTPNVSTAIVAPGTTMIHG